MIACRTLLKQGSYAALACVAQIGVCFAAPPATSLSALWSNDGGDKVTQDELRATLKPSAVVNSVWDGKTIKQFGAKNEVVSFNLVLEAATKTATNVSVTLSNLTGPDGAIIRSNQTRPKGELFDWTTTEAELFYVRYLQLRGLSQFAFGTLSGSGFEPQVPAKLRLPMVGGVYTGNYADRPNANKYYPDIAVPIELVPTFTIAAGHNQSIWADIYIPTNIASGTYTGSVTVSENGVKTHTLPVRLTVRNFALPDSPAAKSMLFSSYGDVAQRYTGTGYPNAGTADDLLGRRVLKNQQLMAHRHKLSMIGDDADFALGIYTTHPSTSYQPFVSGTAFTAANGYAGPGVGVPNNVYSIGAYGHWGNSKWPATQAGFNTNTNDWETWFRANAPTVERFVYLSDESSNYAQTQEWANWMATNPGVGVNLKSMATVPAPDAVLREPSLRVPTSTFSAGLGSTWANAVAKIRATPNADFWMYNGSRPAQGIANTEGDGTDLRARCWAQYKLGVGRWFAWETTYYNDTQTGSGQGNLFVESRTFNSKSSVPDPVKGLFGNNGEGVLFYPGTDAIYPAYSYGIPGPIASLRLKHWRRGVQDIDYVTLAAAINPKEVAKIVQKMVPRVLWELPVDNPNDATYHVNTPASWSSNPDDWEEARLALADIIDGTVKPAAVQLTVQ